MTNDTQITVDAAQNASQIASTQAPAALSTVSRPPEERAKILARLVIREGKQYRTSALEAGYSPATARKSLGWLMSESTIVADAIRRETAVVQSDIHVLKPLAIQRLYREIVDPDSPNGIKAIELAGRFKETDWFVRHSEQNLGVFIAISDNPPSDAALVIDQYKD